MKLKPTLFPALLTILMVAGHCIASPSPSIADMRSASVGDYKYFLFTWSIRETKDADYDSGGSHVILHGERMWTGSAIVGKAQYGASTDVYSYTITVTTDETEQSTYGGCSTVQHRTIIDPDRYKSPALSTINMSNSGVEYPQQRSDGTWDMADPWDLTDGFVLGLPQFTYRLTTTVSGGCGTSSEQTFHDTIGALPAPSDRKRLTGGSAGQVFGDDYTYQFLSTYPADPNNTIHRTVTATTIPEPPLQITGVTLKHQDYPTSDWVTIPAAGTIDGNQVQITAEILNPKSTDQRAEIRFINGETGLPFPGGIATFTIASKETLKIIYMWDTDGFAWNNNSTPHLDPRKIEVQLKPTQGSGDTEKKDLKVVPKPVILVHGLWSDAGTWAPYESFLQSVRSDWHAYAVQGMDTGKLGHVFTGGNAIIQNAAIVASYINTIRNDTNAWHVDMVGHSMGGLISRKYIHDMMPASPDTHVVVAHLVMLGTPNRGSVCADNIDAVFPTISPYGSRFNINLFQLRTSYIIYGFNITTQDNPDVKYAALAGRPLPETCGSPDPGDSVVPVKSAWWHYTDVYNTDTFHTSMTASFPIFSNFVKPHLAIGPSSSAMLRTNHNLATLRPESLTPQEDSSSLQVLSAQVVTLPKDSTNTITVTIQVPNASKLGVTLLAPPSVGALLRDSAGSVVTSISAESENAKQPFRSLLVDAPSPGQWQLVLENQGTEQMELPVSVWIEGNSFNLQVKTNNIGLTRQALVSASLRKDGNPVTDTSVTSYIEAENGEVMSLPLQDNGQNGDVHSGDGIYSAITPELALTSYLVVVKVGEGEKSRIASAGINLVFNRVYIPITIANR